MVDVSDLSTVTLGWQELKWVGTQAAITAVWHYRGQFTYPKGHLAEGSFFPKCIGLGLGLGSRLELVRVRIKVRVRVSVIFQNLHNSHFGQMTLRTSDL